MMMNPPVRIPGFICALLACALMLGSARSTLQEGRRVVPVTNIVPTGAQPIRGAAVKVEVIDAVDIQTSSGNWRLKVAVRIRNARGDRVRCTLDLKFDGKTMGDYQVDIPAGETDVTLFSAYAGDGKGAKNLSRLSADARSIRIGE